MFLEQMEIITDETLRQEKKFLEVIKNQNSYEEDTYEKLLKIELDYLIQFEYSLIEVYENSEEKLKNCG